ncbi:hypothetical protein [Thermococcus sp.]
MAFFMVLTGLLAWSTRNGSVPFYVLGINDWVWLVVVILTVFIWFGHGSKA